MAARSLKLQHISVLHGILKELKFGNQIGTPSYKFIMEQYKANQTTAAKYCRDPQAASYDASTYYCLLRSSREFDELCTKYNSGEDSIKKAAERVGLKLPETYSGSEVNGSSEK